jgi:hypothetical protein
MQRETKMRWRIVLVVALVAACTGAFACSYPKHRLEDAADMFDLGLTFSKKPQFSAYMNCPVIAPIGYGKVDGEFIGVGGGKVGVMEHHQESSGLLFWGREEVSWDTFDPDDADTISVQGVGILGLADNAGKKEPYDVACKHYLHLGWIGITANVHWLEIPDFFLGFFLLDPMHDDGEDGGYWFWGARTASTEDVEPALASPGDTPSSTLP